MDLRRVPLLAGVDDASLQMISDCIEWTELAGGQVLVEQGVAADAVYVLASGRCDVFLQNAGKEAWIERLAPVALIGEIALITGRRRTASVRAVRDCTVGRLSADDFLALLDRPGIGTAVARVLASRLSASRMPSSELPSAVPAL